jgi:hypothetical protein
MAATAQDSTAPLRMGPEKKDEDQDEYESEWLHIAVVVGDMRSHSVQQQTHTPQAGSDRSD